MQLAEANLATVSKYVEEKRAKEQQETKAKEQQEAEAKAIQEAEKEMGIDICSNSSTKQQIKEYLTKIGVQNIQSLN